MEKQPDEPTQTYEEIGEAERLKRRLRLVEKMLKESARDDAEESVIAQAIKENIASRPEVPPARARKLGKSVIRASGILDIGDTHYGENVSPRSNGNIAEFNREIAKERFDFVIEEAIRLGKLHDIRSMWVINGGDMISGFTVFEEIDRVNEVQAIDQLLEWSEVMYGGLEKLCQHFPEVNFVGVAGNHARLRQKAYFRDKQVDNLDYLSYKILEQKGKEQSNLHFHTPDTFWKVIDVEDRKMLVMHGDSIKQQNSMNIPWYGIQKEALKWRSMQKEVGDFDDLMLHHFHNPVRWNIGDMNVFVNGALKGKDDYTVAGARTPAPAAQRFLTVAGGEVKADYLIGLDHIGRTTK